MKFKNSKHVRCFKIEIYTERSWILQKPAKREPKKCKLVTFQPKAYRKHLSLCPRSEKPSNFDYFTVMVVFLLVYMKLLL